MEGGVGGLGGITLLWGWTSSYEGGGWPLEISIACEYVPKNTTSFSNKEAFSSFISGAKGISKILKY